MHQYRAHLAARFEIGSRNYRSAETHQLGSLHLVYIATEYHAAIGKNDKDAVSDIEAALPADDDIRIVYSLHGIAQSPAQIRQVHARYM